MEEVVKGLWDLADHHEQRGEIGKAIKCLEAICQSPDSFLPVLEIKTRLRVATLLLKHSHNFNHAKDHLKRAQHLLESIDSIPFCFELKCRAYTLLSQCYHLVRENLSQKQILNKGLELSAISGDEFKRKFWLCNFNSQLANALVIEGDYNGSISALEKGFTCAMEMFYPELQWESTNLVEESVNTCNLMWESIEPVNRQQCIGLSFYHELLQLFYLLRICDYKLANQRIDNLDALVKSDLHRMQNIKDLTSELDALKQSMSRSNLNHKDRSALAEKQSKLEEQLNQFTGTNSTGKTILEPAYFGNVKRTWDHKLELAPPPADGEWLPRRAVYALVDLMVVIFSRPKGLFEDCKKRIQSGLQIIQEELMQLGITENIKEVELQHSAFCMAGVYLMLLMQFLENKVVTDLTRTEFVEAQEALVQMRNWFVRFPTILHTCESTIEMLKGQYAHSVGCYDEAVFHFLEAAKLTRSKSMQAMTHTYAAVSLICINDAESSAKAVHLVEPVLGVLDSFVGVREKTCALYAYGILLMRQNKLLDARMRLASGLESAHTDLGNLQLVSQYCSLLGTVALSIKDIGQAREILKSALTLAKKLYDIPTQNWVLRNLTALYQRSRNIAIEMENMENIEEIIEENIEYENRTLQDLQRRLDLARLSNHHYELIDKVKLSSSVERA